MQRGVIVLVTALGLTQPAQAQPSPRQETFRPLPELSPPDRNYLNQPLRMAPTVTNSVAWSETPTAAELAAAFPASAVGRTPTGTVVLRCSIALGGQLTHCDSLVEAPVGMGFAAAARGLSTRFKVFSDPAYLRAVEEFRVDVPFHFCDPSQPATPLEVSDPMWLQTANPDVADRLFPAAAIKAGLTTGRGTLDCLVEHDGSLSNCSVESEEPPSLGFGHAALAVASLMRMNAWTKQGAPVDGAHIHLPIRVSVARSPTDAQRATPHESAPH
jgi:hypothetical protein